MEKTRGVEIRQETWTLPSAQEEVYTERNTRGDPDIEMAKDYEHPTEDRAPSAPTPISREKTSPISELIIPSGNSTTKKFQTELPAEWQPTKPRQDQARAVPKQKKPKARGLTDGQRAAWAHAHYIINHGTTDDAARFLTFPKNANRTPAEALHQIRVLARRRIPTWEQAKDVIFSSSESGTESLEAHTQLCTSIIPLQPGEKSDTDNLSTDTYHLAFKDKHEQRTTRTGK